MKKEIHEARKKHCDLFKSNVDHIQLQAFIERIENWMSIEKAIITPKNYRSTKYQPYSFRR